MKSLTQIARVLVGVLFILSGLIKANDTLGFSYKLLEYFEIFGTQFLDPYAVLFSMVICIFEIVSGVALLLGIYTQLNTWLLLLLIIFFTLLTGYSAITHKVTDCGCFGDAVKLTPMTSFMKDVGLLILILLLFIRRKDIHPLFNRVICNIALFIAGLVSVFFTCYTYMFLPVKDFLPYRIGNDIQELSVYPPDAEKDVVEMIFEYEKEGKTYSFTTDQLPDDIEQYNFVNRVDKVIKKGYQPPIHDFKLYDLNGMEYTDSLFSGAGYKLILVQTRLSESRSASISSLAQLGTDWQNAGFPLWALTSTNLQDANQFAKENGIGFTYYNMDAIPLKSMVRSNPGAILLKGNNVIKKWGAYNLPSFETLKKYMH